MKGDPAQRPNLRKLSWIWWAASRIRSSTVGWVQTRMNQPAAKPIAAAITTAASSRRSPGRISQPQLLHLVAALAERLQDLLHVLGAAGLQGEL